MTAWADFCSGLELGALVPDQFAQYRPAVAEAFGFFLQNLSSDRALGILAEQATLPEEAGIEERLVAVARHSPALHKLGQVLARDRRVPPKLRRLLQGLEAMKPTESVERIRIRLEAELGPLSRLGVRLGGEPLAEASAAVVVPFAWRGRRGVFKLLKPAVEERFAEDLRLLRHVGGLLDERCERYGLPRIAYEGTLAEVADLLAHEVRLEAEQEHLRAARDAHRYLPSVVVPEVFPALSTPRVTAMERVDGRKVTDVHRMPGWERRVLADLIIEALIARPLWAADHSALFHADPHAGNLMVTADRRLVLLDWSLVGRLTKHDRVGLSQILLAALTLDAQRIADAIRGLAGGSIDAAALRRVVDDQLGRLRRDARPGLAWLTALMDGAATEARARFAPNLLLFRKALHTLEGVIADVSEERHVDTALAASFLTRLALEWGPRMLAPPLSRAFGTHLSNLDLARLALAAPLTASPRWFG